MRARRSGVTRSSASSASTQSPAAWSRAKFFCAAKPGHARTHTRSVNSRASATVLSVDSPSITTIASAPAPPATGAPAGPRPRLGGLLAVDHHDLVGPRHALETGAQALFLVPRHDGHREARHRALPLSSISRAAA